MNTSYGALHHAWEPWPTSPNDDPSSEPLYQSLRYPGWSRNQELPVLGQDATLDSQDHMKGRTKVDRAELHNSTGMEPRKFDAVTSPRPGQVPENTRSSLLRLWWLEIIACFVAFAMLVAIVVILYQYQHSPLPRWRYNLSVNSVIAIYVAAMKVSMLLVVAEGLSQLKWFWYRQRRPLKDMSKYDRASRGPKGAVSLLVALRAQSLVTTLGALLTVVAVALDPFAQQIIRYYSCQIPDTGSQATIARSTFFAEVGGHLGAGLSTVAIGLQSSMNAGIFSPQTTGVAFDCGTSNCTFPGSYSTVGYCSTCEDVTSELTIHNLTRSVGSPAFNYTLPGTKYSNGTYSYFSGTDVDDSIDSALFTMNCGVETVSFFSSSTCEMIMSRYTGTYFEQQGCADTLLGNSMGNWYCRGYGAARCELYPCIRSYEGAVKNGKLQERQLDTAHSWSYSSAAFEPAVTLDTNCLSIKERINLVKHGYDLRDDTQWLAFNNSIDVTTGKWSDPSGVQVNPACIYQIGYLVMSSVAGFLPTWLTGQIRSVDDYIGGPSNLQILYGLGYLTFDVVNSTFANITKAMTEYIRQAGSHSYTNSYNSTFSGIVSPVHGVAYQETTCIQVYWVWLIYPACLVIATFVFFVAMLGKTRRDPAIDDWRSSPLPLLFLDVDRSLNPLKHHDIIRVKELERTTGDLHMHLACTKEGWKLTGEQSAGNHVGGKA